MESSRRRRFFQAFRRTFHSIDEDDAFPIPIRTHGRTNMRRLILTQTKFLPFIKKGNEIQEKTQKQQPQQLVRNPIGRHRGRGRGFGKEMIWNIKSLVDRLKEGVKEAVETAIEERLTNTKDMQRRESVVAERETTWKDQLYRREVPSSRLSLSLTRSLYKTFFYKFKFFFFK